MFSPLHRFYTAYGKFCPVFPPLSLFSHSVPKPHTHRIAINSRSEHGSPVYGCHHRFFTADTGIGRGLRQIGKKKMTLAYLLSGAVSLALLVYLVIALIRAEDL
jgi:K+-transporting ATPase KdpF subunit